MLTQVKQFNKVCEILDKHERDSAKLITILQEIQEEYRYLPEEILAFVATSLDISPAKIFGVATFYSHFALEPKGKYVVKLCDGTACHVKKSTTILDALYKKLSLSDEKQTTDDLLFTVETVSCLGACGLAPVMLVNEDVYGAITPDQAVEVVAKIIEKEGKA